jgi:branched-chain amino acid transport system substrate-binding protein
MFKATTAVLASLMLWPALVGAEEPVKIGVVYPLTGVAASAGIALKFAIETALDIINNPHPELSAIPLGATAGLPNLGGRKVEADIADHQGNPATAQSQTLRIITQDHVVALLGAYQSSSALTASAVAERYGIPFVAGEAASPNLTERGFKWFFRTTPIGTDFGRAYTAFLHTLKQQGHQVDAIAVVNENTEYGTSVGNAISKAVEDGGMKVTLRIPYNANSTDVSAQVLQLKDAHPDVVVFVSYTSDAILFLKTMHSLDYKPQVVIGDDSGFSDSAFVTAVGDLAQGAINRSSYDIGKPGTTSYIVNEMYKARAGHDLDDTSARGMEGFLVLCDAINRAGSTAPDKIQAALRITDLKAGQLMIGYDGVRFDAKGQNVLGATLLVQLHGDHYVPVWPTEKGQAELEMPFQGWH